MAQIIPFPGTAHVLVQTAVAITAAANKAHAEGGASASPATAIVRPIRKGLRIPKKQRAADEATLFYAKVVAASVEKAEALAQTAFGSQEHRTAVHMQGLACQLPRNNLRCIVSTLDEERDFDLRCTELDILHAEHVLINRRIDRLCLLEGVPFWKSPTIKPMVDQRDKAWEAYRERLVEMAEMPARTYSQLNRKRRLIGTVWLKAKGEQYDRMRAAIEVDETWLAANRPKRRRGA